MTPGGWRLPLYRSYYTQAYCTQRGWAYRKQTELAATLIELTGSRSRIVHRAGLQDDPRQRRPDISKAQDVMSWSPTTMLKDGLVRTIAYFEQLLSDRNLRELVAGEARG